MILPKLQQRIFDVLLALCLMLGAVYLINITGTRGAGALLSIVSSLVMVGWIVFSGSNWWMLMPISLAFGGALLVQHKFYAHEMALLICLLSLLPQMLFRSDKRMARTALPWCIYALLAVFVGDWAVSVYDTDSLSMANLGSLSRAYMHGVWALVFGLMFYKWGVLNLRLMLRLLYVTFVVRAILGGFAYFFQEVFSVSEVGYVLSGASVGLSDFRFTGVQLGILAFVYGRISPGFWWKVGHNVVVILSAVLVAFGGGRVALGMFFVIPLIWAVICRRIGWLAIGCTAGLAFIVLLNQHPQWIYLFPDEVQRSLSIFVSESSTRWVDWQTRNVISNQWHAYLAQLGLQRWTESVVTFLFGNRVEPFNEIFNAYSATWEVKAEVAAQLGLYESGLWTTLGCIGLVGLLLYASLFFFLLKDPFRIVKQEGILDLQHGLYFMAVAGGVLWAVFSWISGNFPSYELMMAFFAKAAYEDQATRSEATDKIQPAEKGNP